LAGTVGTARDNHACLVKDCARADKRVRASWATLLTMETADKATAAGRAVLVAHGPRGFLLTRPRARDSHVRALASTAASVGRSRLCSGNRALPVNDRALPDKALGAMRTC
jgi:hypothetical protein